MKINFVIFLITVFLVANTYYDGKFTEYVLKGKKYYKMATFAFVGLSIYIFINKNPKETKNLIAHATDLIRYMPIDSNTSDMLTPIFDFTNANDKLSKMYKKQNINTTPQMKRMIHSGGNSAKRSVSETKKKFVASSQNWLCGECNKQLNAWFEVDHKTRLEHGGSNEVNNLVALCRECHGQKTAMENM